MTDHSALIERLEAMADEPSRLVREVDRVLAEAAAALRDLTEWRDIADHDNSATEVLVETDKGAVMVAWRHHQPHPVRPLPSAPNQAKGADKL